TSGDGNSAIGRVYRGSKRTRPPTRSAATISEPCHSVGTLVTGAPTSSRCRISPVAARTAHTEAGPHAVHATPSVVATALPIMWLKLVGTRHAIVPVAASSPRREPSSVPNTSLPPTYVGLERECPGSAVRHTTWPSAARTA